jgi:UDP-N-acetylmuramate dehydrogenase
MLSQIEEHVSLAQFTTLKIGGRARFFLAAKHEKEIIEAVQFAEQNKLKFFILGGGSNVLIADEGFDGLVLQVALKGVSVFQKSDETVFVTAGAGEDWDEFVAFCVERNLQGVECLSGIPLAERRYRMSAHTDRKFQKRLSQYESLTGKRKKFSIC